LKITVIGGGAAGFFAAIHAAEAGAEVTLLEKSGKLLTKVKVSGGGRCNVTNSVTDPSLLVLNYPRGGRELRGPFSRFGTSETRLWFESKGIQLKSEEDGRVFPTSDSSQTIIDCLMSEAANRSVKICLNTVVKKITKLHDLFIIETDNDKIECERVIIATGGNPSMRAYDWLTMMQHTIKAPVPSLFTFNIPDNPFKDLMGLSVNSAAVKISGTRFSYDGPLLFTHWGLSGPVVLKLSSFAARFLNEKNYLFDVTVNFLPQWNEEELRFQLAEYIQLNRLKKVRNSRFGMLPSRLWERLCEHAGIDELMKWADAGKVTVNKLVYHLNSTTFHVNGKTTFREEFVTCGGVDLKQINMKTMESKIMPGLFFAGEVLDIDGITGGFNFQAAWTTGFIAGTSAATILK